MLKIKVPLLYAQYPGFMTREEITAEFEQRYGEKPGEFLETGGGILAGPVPTPLVRTWTEHGVQVQRLVL